jgi:nucleoside-diphosphate-sugar epimerase
VLLWPTNLIHGGKVALASTVAKLGIRKIVIASSETIYGVCFAEGDRDFLQFPLEEDYDVDPMDSYGLSKLVGEKTARAFASRTGADIYALRIGGLIEPDEYHRFHGFIDDPSLRRRDAWTYIDARDLGQIVHLCVQRDGLGFQVFNSVNDEIIANEPTTAFLAKHAPNTRITREMGTFEGPLSNRKAREVLGFKEEHNWRKYLMKT